MSVRRRRGATGAHVAGLLGVAGIFAAALAGCGDSVEVGDQTDGAKEGGQGDEEAKGAAPPAGKEAGTKNEESQLRVTKDDLVAKGVTNRDPFRSYAESFKVQEPDVVQRRVLMPDISVDQMRLVAIISGVSQPKAMLTDPAGVGHVVERGDYVGRAEVVQTGGAEGMPVTLNWQIDRIRANEIVLTRKNPTNPDEPPLTRVVPLHEEKEEG